MRDRAILVFAYVAIVATILAGVFRVSWWAVIACASVLALVSLTASFGAFSRYAYAGGTISSRTIFASTALNSTSAAAAAYVFGLGLGWALAF